MRYLLLLLLIISCGKANVPAFEGNSNLIRNWSGLYEDPAFSGMKINEANSTNRLILCNGRYAGVNRLSVGSEAMNSMYDPDYNPNNDPYFNPSNDPYFNPVYNYNENFTYTYPYNTYIDYQAPYSDPYIVNQPQVNNPRPSINQNSNFSNAGRGQFVIQASNENEGYLSVGELPYLGASNPNCQLFSNKILSYEVAGTRLIICLPSPQENICFDYSEAYF